MNRKVFVKKHRQEDPLMRERPFVTVSTFTLFCSGLTCAAEEALLDGTNPVPDIYFTATSEWSGSYAAHNARVGASNYWASTYADAVINPPTVYLQVSKVYIIYLLLCFCH